MKCIIYNMDMAKEAMTGHILIQRRLHDNVFVV